MPEEIQPIVPLTDPVVENITGPVAAPLPATPPKRSKNLLAIPIIIITVLAVAAAGFFYLQNQQLKNQILEPSPTPLVQISPEPAGPSAAPFASPSATPAATPAEQVLSIAQKKYPQAQLILITIDNPQQPSSGLTKYWFRQTPDIKKYFYVSSSTSGFNLVDQQVYLSPDNNIPSLNQRLLENKLGISVTQALDLTQALCPDTQACQTAAVKAQFIDGGSRLLWQISYQIPDQPQPLIFQIDSLTQKIVYQSSK